MFESQKNPFDGDALNRQEFAANLISFITSLENGVLAIDGEWGVGKSWLGKSIKESIDQKELASTIWIDTFEADWSDDPSLSVIAEISNSLSDSESSTFIKKASTYAARLVPAGTKAAVEVVGNLMGVDKNVISGLSDALKDSSNLYIERRLQDLAERQKSLANLKALLSKTVKNSDSGKLVIFVDELDRCSPEFAVRFLERLKHLFNIENIVFVLFWNRQQVQNAVEVFYGSKTNSQMYLDKFIDYQLHLPISHVRESEGAMGPFLNTLITKHEGVERHALLESFRLLNIILSLLNLTAREVERVTSWWILSTNRHLLIFETWLLGLKIKHPNLFNQLRINNPDAHLEIKKMIEHIYVDKNVEPLVNAIIDIHDRYHRNDFSKLDPQTENILGNNTFVEYDKLLYAAIRRIETIR